MTDADTLPDPRDPEVRERLHRARIYPADGKPFFWENPNVPRDAAEVHRGQLVEELLRRERVHGPPTRAGMLQRLEYEARHDPLMPPWLHRYWFVPSEAMLALDALFEETFGAGYSIAGSGAEGDRAIRSADLWTDFTMLVYPTPGTVGSPERRKVLEKEIPVRLAALGIPRARVSIWDEVEPARAFQGLMAGSHVREGYKRLGIPREYEPYPEDLDNW